MDTKTIAQAQRQAEICGVFANYRRVMILWTLAAGEKSVGEIATAVHASLQNISQHLRLMKERGILQSHRNGQTIHYSIVPDAISANCRLLMEARQN